MFVAEAWDEANHKDEPRADSLQNIELRIVGPTEQGIHNQNVDPLGNLNPPTTTCRYVLKVIDRLTVGSSPSSPQKI
jgi:hypothetical protein